MLRIDEVMGLEIGSINMLPCSRESSFSFLSLTFTDERENR